MNRFFLMAFALIVPQNSLQAAVVFDVTSTSSTAAGPFQFVLDGPRSLNSSPLPQNQAGTGFKMFGSVAARNDGADRCIFCRLSLIASGNLLTQGGINNLPLPVPVGWEFRVDEYSALQIEDGTSNTILFRETLPPSRIRNTLPGGIPDGTSNTIVLGEEVPFEQRDFIYRLMIIYQSQVPENQISDGSSNTILIGERIERQIASGNGYFGDQIEGEGFFPLERESGGFEVQLQILPTNLAVNRGIRVHVPENSIDINGLADVPEPAGVGLMVCGLSFFGFLRRRA